MIIALSTTLSLRWSWIARRDCFSGFKVEDGAWLSDSLRSTLLQDGNLGSLVWLAQVDGLIGRCKMRIGIIVYSQTGNTLSVAEKLKQRLVAAGHSTEIEQVTVVGGRKAGGRNFQLDTRPDAAQYEALVFGSAVEAFSLSPVLATYLRGIGSLDGKRIACLVTQFFPYRWMGGNRAIRQMHKLCKSKGATMRGTAVVNWSKFRRAKTTVRAIDRLTQALA